MTADRQRQPLPRLAARMSFTARPSGADVSPPPVRPALTARRHVDLARVSSAICSR